MGIRVESLCVDFLAIQLQQRLSISSPHVHRPMLWVSEPRLSKSPRAANNDILESESERNSTAMYDLINGSLRRGLRGVVGKGLDDVCQEKALQHCDQCGRTLGIMAQSLGAMGTCY